jgi:hypothetical protein
MLRWNSFVCPAGGGLWYNLPSVVTWHSSMKILSSPPPWCVCNDDDSGACARNSFSRTNANAEMFLARVTMRSTMSQRTRGGAADLCACYRVAIGINARSESEKNAHDVDDARFVYSFRFSAVQPTTLTDMRWIFNLSHCRRSVCSVSRLSLDIPNNMEPTLDDFEVLKLVGQVWLPKKSKQKERQDYAHVIDSVFKICILIQLPG